MTFTGHVTADYILHSRRILQTKALRGEGWIMENMFHCLKELVKINFCSNGSKQYYIV